MSHDPLFHVHRKVIVGIFPFRQQFHFTVLDIPTREKGNAFDSHEQANEWITKNRNTLNLPIGASAVEVYFPESKP